MNRIDSEGQRSASVVKKRGFTRGLLDRLAGISANATRTSTSPADHDENIREQFKERADRFDYVVVAKEGEEVVGYGGYRELRVRRRRSLGRSKVLYESAKMVDPSSQGRGHGRRISHEAITHSDPDYIAARTQNPHEVSSLKKAADNIPLAPVDVPYRDDSDLETTMERTAKKLGANDRVERVRVGRGKAHPTGVLKGMYGSEFGEHPVDPQGREESSAVERRFRELGVDQQAGDAVLVMGRRKPRRK